MSEDEPGQANVHAAWRMSVAEQAAGVYGQNKRVAALAAAGSVGSGLADRYSDLELDCYWHEPPSDRDRLAPVEQLGGQLEQFWEYYADEEEWSEDYQLGLLHVTMSNFLVASVERWIDDVVLRADTDPAKHMRLAAVQRGRALVGPELIGDWRARADRYPDALVAAMVERSLDPDALRGWAAREALVSRGDEIAVHALLASLQQAVFGAVLAINRVYAPHRLAKWQRHLLAGLTLTPDRLAERLDSMWQAASPTQAFGQAEALLTETAGLAEQVTGVTLGEFREVLAQRREAVDPPPDA
jgi:Domain of unknown function (DUF4037)